MRTSITPKFVQAVPDKLQDGVLYVSMEYATVVHKCLCGCGKEVATPLSPTDWCLTFDGDSVSLAPSVGNWSFPCRSHYWIRNNQVLWCGDMPQALIDAGRARDRRDKAKYYASKAPAAMTKPIGPARTSQEVNPPPFKQEPVGFLKRLRNWATGLR